MLSRRSWRLQYPVVQPRLLQPQQRHLLQQSTRRRRHRRTSECPPLGIAKEFSLFIRGDINRTGGIEGTIAAGGNVTTSSSGIASSFTGDPHTLDALVVGGNLNISNDSVNGNVIVGELQR
ncbi:collagen-binding domain-containing protein [Paenibacillus rhizoplanae]